VIETESGIRPRLLRRQRADLHQHIFLAHHQGSRVQRGEFESMSVRDGVRGAGFNTIAAEDAAVVIDVVDLGITLGGGDALCFGILRRLNENAVRRTRRSAQEAGYALLQAVLVALQHVRAAKALLEHRSAQRAFAVRVVFHLGGLEDFSEGDAHALGNGGDVAHD